MQLSTRLLGAVMVVDIRGRATAEDNEAMRAAMTQLLEQGYRKIVINFAELDYLDSAALGELVACQLRGIRVDAPLKIASPSRRLQDLLILTRLTTVFETHDSLGAAIESFTPRTL